MTTVCHVMDGSTTKIAAVILTLDEEEFIASCLKHLEPYVDWTLVLDGQSKDGTLEIAQGNADQVISRKFSGSFAQERNYAQDRIPLECNWILHCDADERFPKEFLENMRQIIKASGVHCFRFPRINRDQTYKKLLLNPQDHQVRLIDKRFCNWARPVHEIVWHKIANKPADQYSVRELSEYPITHLKREKSTRQRILQRWKTLEEQQNPTM